ncbi:type II secretion system F family protein [Streptomyces axinellae]|uniref:Type II secretion system protein GspF domain-containing protein n=1 Tax=Streptomyces axinellae TaxID=552788 RepID=A0ABP6C7F5_9ACTN
MRALDGALWPEWLAASGPAAGLGAAGLGAGGLVPRVWMWVSVLSAAGCVTGVVVALRGESGVRRRALGLFDGAPAVASVWADARARWRAAPGRGRGWGRQEGPASGPKSARGWEQWLRERRVLERAGVLSAGMLGAQLVGGGFGLLVGVVAAGSVWRWLRGRSLAGESDDADERTAREQLPLAADLMAACLAAGAGPERASEAVGGSLGGPLGERLTSAATELRLGAEPDAVWGRFAKRPWGEEFARCMERAGTAGVPAVESVTRLATELRGREARAATGRARRAAVQVTGPLGLCFLPAFLVIGVVPVVLGLAKSLW